MSVSHSFHFRPFAAFLLLGLFVAAAAAQTAAPSADPFPMSEGTYWIYRGTVRWTHDINRVSATKVTWKTELRKVFRRGKLLAAVVNGFPSDMDWSDGNPTPTDSLVIRSGMDDYYLIDSDMAQQSVKTLVDSGAPLERFLNDDAVFLRLPLKKGKKFCDPDGMAREDGMYCWVVSSVDPISLKAVKGLAPGMREAYEIRYVTNPDDISYKFVPGVGIISYDYHHHGTVADTELKLVEFHPGP
jgi:hypothetical protein